MNFFSKSKPDIWFVISSIIGLVIVIPILTIIIQLFDGPGDNWAHFQNTLFQRYFFNTLLLVLGVSCITLFFGVLTAWFVVAYDFSGRKMFEWSLMLPLSIPTYISAITYAGIFDFTGPIHAIVKNVFGLNPVGLVPDIMNITGVIFVISMVLYPYVYMVSKSAFLSQSQTIIENSRLLGSSPSRTFIKVALPMARPFIFGGLVLVLMEVLNDYGAVKYYGVQNFTTGIFKAWFSMGDLNAAIYLSAILMLFVFAVLWFEKWQRRKINYQESSRSSKSIRRFNVSWPISLTISVFCFLPLFFGFILPVMQLLSWARVSVEAVTLDFIEMAFNSIFLATIGAILCASTAVIVIYTKRLHLHSKVINLISQLAVLGYSIPGAVIAVGILVPLIVADKLLIQVVDYLFQYNVGLLLGGTVFGLVLAYLIRFLVVAYNPIDAGFSKSCENLEEASRSLGVGKFKTLLKVDLPLIKGAVLSGAILVFVDILKELPLTLILRPFNFDTLATQAFRYASDEMISHAALPALVIIATGLIPVILINKLISKNA